MRYVAALLLCLLSAPAQADMAWDALAALPAAHSVRAIVTDAALAEGVPARIALAIVRVESNFNPSLRGREGEWGLYQIKCRTAQGLGFRGPCAALAQAAVNARWGARHLALAIKHGGFCFHQAGLGARRCSRAYTARVNAAMR